MGGGILKGGNQIFQTVFWTENQLQRLPAAAHLGPGMVCVTALLRYSSGCGNFLILPSFCAVWVWGLSVSHIQECNNQDRLTAPDHERCDCSGSLLSFCHEGKVAENLCNLLTSPNRCRTTFFKYTSRNQSQEQFLLISEMTELSSAGCRCRSLAGVWI